MKRVLFVQYWVVYRSVKNDHILFFRRRTDFDIAIIPQRLRERGEAPWPLSSAARISAVVVIADSPLRVLLLLVAHVVVFVRVLRCPSLACDPGLGEVELPTVLPSVTRLALDARFYISQEIKTIKRRTTSFVLNISAKITVAVNIF